MSKAKFDDVMQDLQTKHGMPYATLAMWVAVTPHILKYVERANQSEFRAAIELNAGMFAVIIEALGFDAGDLMRDATKIEAVRKDITTPTPQQSVLAHGSDVV